MVYISSTAFVLLFHFACFLLKSDGKPLRKRAISEMQLMHNFGEHKHLLARQDWLQMKLKDVHTAFVGDLAAISPDDTGEKSKSQHDRTIEERTEQNKSRGLRHIHFPENAMDRESAGLLTQIEALKPSTARNTVT
ncbi:parathyroid hormone [Protopterus annectens]|uniref:parathyroid hormone n=1 Tax=Protopterus annectens TaxID=7888 RepID=UPI001CFC4173|nr:parathyroid hormone [Protopterus annectens]